VRTEDRALAADQFLASLAEVDEGALVVDAVAELEKGYAGGIGVWEMDEISDWPSRGFLDLDYFLVGVLEPYFSLPLETDFSFSLPLDLDLEAADFWDLS